MSRKQKNKNVTLNLSIGDLISYVYPISLFEEQRADRDLNMTLMSIIIC